MKRCPKCGYKELPRISKVRAKLGTQPQSKPWRKDRSEELKKARGYTDPKSFVRIDGSEVLHNQDWRNRKMELAERSGGICEYVEGPDPFNPLTWRCARSATIPAHIEPRYPRRDDRMNNLRHYCYEHDRLTEKQSWRKTRFGEKVRSGKVEAAS